MSPWRDVECPHCAIVFQSHEQEGSVACPYCHEPVEVPKPATGFHPSTKPAPPAADAPEFEMMLCPDCFAGMRVWKWESEHQCPQCKSIFSFVPAGPPPAEPPHAHPPVHRDVDEKAARSLLDTLTRVAEDSPWWQPMRHGATASPRLRMGPPPASPGPAWTLDSLLGTIRNVLADRQPVDVVRAALARSPPPAPSTEEANPEPLSRTSTEAPHAGRTHGRKPERTVSS